MTLEVLAQDQRFDSQLALVREHWRAVRHFWLDDPDVPAARKLRSELPRDFWIGAGMPGLATIKLTGAGRFDFAEDGRTALIVACYDGLPGLLDANSGAHVEALLDLVAVDLDHPDRYWRRRGEALVLGAAYLDIAGQEGAPVPVFRNPLSWLRSAGAGVVLLDWAWARGLLLDLELVAEDLDLGDRLQAALMPSILVMEAA